MRAKLLKKLKGKEYKEKLLQKDRKRPDGRDPENHRSILISKQVPDKGLFSNSVQFGEGGTTVMSYMESVVKPSHEEQVILHVEFPQRPRSILKSKVDRKYEHHSYLRNMVKDSIVIENPD